MYCVYFFYENEHTAEMEMRVKLTENIIGAPLIRRIHLYKCNRIQQQE